MECTGKATPCLRLERGPSYLRLLRQHLGNSVRDGVRFAVMGKQRTPYSDRCDWHSSLAYLYL